MGWGGAPERLGALIDAHLRTQAGEILPRWHPLLRLLLRDSVFRDDIPALAVVLARVAALEVVHARSREL